jgi:voltage-gated potassium channel
MSIKQRVYRALFEPQARWEQGISIGLAVLITVNVVLVVISTVPDLSDEAIVAINRFELASVVVFIAEYLLRVWVAPLSPRYAYGPILGRIRYIFSPLAILDLAAILPVVIPLLTTLNLQWLRVLRLLRIFTILRLGRWSEGLRLMTTVAYRLRGELGAVLLITSVILLLASSMMYFLEQDVQPEVFGSIPAALWWGIITLTTVGYGDAAPVTALGKIVGGMVALMGVGVGALPAGILATGLHDEMLRRRRRHEAAAGGAGSDPDDDEEPLT